ncbi:hypothetical protein CRG98_048375 [Punica granatum]|uniref:protein-serine/threonine phosphatase n=1 Tax=Punica granatum TaxID=22663 RepID=A0A2I0HHT5_PUNGR|nr:hypothetical protein CRG98_048375 [Punica granatum]
MALRGDIHGQYAYLLRLFELGGFPPKTNYLFLRNHIGYGKQSLATICLLFAYKIKHPDNFFLLRGDHECAPINLVCGFSDECKWRFNATLWEIFINCFNCLPIAARFDDKILCIHEGLSPYLSNLDQIRNIPTRLLNMERWGKNDGGVSYTFGANTVSQFLVKCDLELVGRAHQKTDLDSLQLVTIFSAPNYCGQFKNVGAIMNVDETLLLLLPDSQPSH